MIHVGNMSPGPVCGACAQGYRATPVGGMIVDPPGAWLDAWDGQDVVPVYDVGEAESVSMEPCSACGTRALGTRSTLTIRLTVPEIPKAFVAEHTRKVDLAEGRVALVAAVADVRWLPEDGEFVATDPKFPGLSGLGPTADDAVRELQVAADVVRTLDTPS